MRGNVTGNLVTGAQTVTIEGTVGGSVLGGAEDLSLANARVGRDFYGFANGVEIGPEANVAGNAMGFGETVDVDGRVGVDFRGFGARVSVSGAVEGDVDGYAGTIAVLPTARVGGNVTGHVDTAGDLERRGRRRRRRHRQRAARRARAAPQRVCDRRLLLRPGHPPRRGVRDGPAACCGCSPCCAEASLPNALAVLRSAGIGLAAAVTLPVAAVIVLRHDHRDPARRADVPRRRHRPVLLEGRDRANHRARRAAQSGDPAALRRDAARRPRHRHRRDQPAVDRRPRKPRADARGLRRDRELDSRALSRGSPA